MDSNKPERIMLDTNVLLSNNFSLDKFDGEIYLSSAVIEELDGLKKAEGELGYKARKANRIIEENLDIIKPIIKDIYDMPDGWQKDKRDNKIVMSAKENECKLFSNDLNVRIKAKHVGVKCEGFEDDENYYKGYKELSGDTDFITKLFNNVKNGINEYNFLQNEYLILHNTDTDKIDEFRYDNGDFIRLKLPESKYIKGLNSHQRLALDLLKNKKIPIKFIMGKQGSGKTFLATKMALNAVLNKGEHGKILIVREPSGEGKEIGYLPGDLNDKTKDFFKPIEQCLDRGKFELESLEKEGIVEKSIPFYLKGTTYNETYMIVDECSDLSYKQLKTVGTRIGMNSCCAFMGDYKQSNYDTSLNNGLIKIVEKLKGDQLVGVVTLGEDVRSPSSKLFADRL